LYGNYGARGITVCEQWYHFKNFVSDMGMKPDQTYTLERANNSLGYSPDNCVWASRSDQCVNRRTFKNNTSGERGVVQVRGGRYQARFDYEGTRYDIGRFDTAEQAAVARAAFVYMFFSDRVSAVASISGERTWATSNTKVRGITPHQDGGFIARCTINGERIYLGYFKTIEEAANARQNRIAQSA
jgi:hypothetical protein